MSDFRWDPSLPRREDMRVELPTWLKWTYGGVFLALVGGLIAVGFMSDNPQTASNERPGISTPATTGSGMRAPAETTGSGAMNRPALPDRSNVRP
jgi:hypothetical protein